jgi:hypothetical protein
MTTRQRVVDWVKEYGETRKIADGQIIAGGGALVVLFCLCMLNFDLWELIS